MLVLSRKAKESIMIGPNIEVRITKIEGDTVRLGIIAPKEVSIFRKEILSLIESSNRTAALSPSGVQAQLDAAKGFLQSKHPLTED